MSEREPSHERRVDPLALSIAALALIVACAAFWAAWSVRSNPPRESASRGVSSARYVGFTLTPGETIQYKGLSVRLDAVSAGGVARLEFDDLTVGQSIQWGLRSDTARILWDRFEVRVIEVRRPGTQPLAGSTGAGKGKVWMTLRQLQPTDSAPPRRPIG